MELINSMFSKLNIHTSFELVRADFMSGEWFIQGTGIDNAPVLPYPNKEWRAVVR
jgi:hypothetical protein